MEQLVSGYIISAGIGGSAAAYGTEFRGGGDRPRHAAVTEIGAKRFADEL